MILRHAKFSEQRLMSMLAPRCQSCATLAMTSKKSYDVLVAVRAVTVIER
jgi:hypothetical protein